MILKLYILQIFFIQDFMSINVFYPLLVRDSQLVIDRHPTISPPALKSADEDLQGCGWDALSYLGLAFVLLLELAVIIGIIACICCCSKNGQISNI